MTDSVITLKDQKFRKVKGVWVDQRKTAAPKDLINLLDKLSAAEASTREPGDVKETKPALPVLPIVAKDFSTAKLESSINLLTKVLQNLSKTIGKKPGGSSRNGASDEAPAIRMFAAEKIPTLREARSLNRKEYFQGTTNKYGERTSSGLLRSLGSINPFMARKYAGQERVQGVIGNQLRQYENTLSDDPNLSKKQINEKIAEKRKELENPKAGPSKPEAKTEAKAAAPAAPSSTGEKQREKTMVQGKSEFASPELSDKKILSVRIAEIDDSVLKKLANIFGKGDNKEDLNKQETRREDPSPNGGGGGLFNRIRNMARGNRKPSAGARTSAPRYAKGAVDASGKKIGGQFIKAGAENVAEQAVKKPGMLSRIMGGATKAGAGAAGARVGARGLLRGAGQLAGRAALPLAVGMEALDYATGEKEVTARNLTGSAGGLGGAAAGAALGATVGSVVPVVGTAIGGIVGGLAGYYGGGALAKGAYDVYDKFTGKKGPAEAVPIKPKAPSRFASVAGAIGKGALTAAGPVGIAALGVSSLLTKPTGVTAQTQALTATTKKVEAAKQQRPAAGPTVINNNVSSPTNVSSSQGVIGGPTVADRGSLNLASF